MSLNLTSVLAQPRGCYEIALLASPSPKAGTKTRSRLVRAHAANFYSFSNHLAIVERFNRNAVAAAGHMPVYIGRVAEYASTSDMASGISI